MWDFFEKNRGCLGIPFHVIAVIYIIICFVTNTKTVHAWFLLIFLVFETAFSLYHRWVSEKKCRKYKREDSFWSKKPEDTEKEEEEEETRE